MASLSQLVQYISTSVSHLQTDLDDEGVTLPLLEESYNRTKEGQLFSAKILSSINDVISQLNQLKDTVAPTEFIIHEMATSPTRTAALRTAIMAHIPELLREAGPQGLHLRDISKSTNIDEGTLGRILRLLESYHIFRQVTPDIFVNNRLSGSLDSKMSTKTLRESTGEYVFSLDTSFITEIECCVNAIAKAASIFPDELVSKSDYSSNPSSPDKNIYSIPKDSSVLSSQSGMSFDEFNYAGSQRLKEAFSALGLSDGSVVVAPNQIGLTTQVVSQLAKEYPEFEFIIQLPRIALSYQLKGLPVASNLKIQERDISAGSNIVNTLTVTPAAFIAMWLDYLPPTYMRKILSTLRKEAIPGQTHLLVYMGLIRENVPPIRHTVDMLKLIANEADEITLKHLDVLMSGTGWKLAKIYEEEGLGDVIWAVAI